MAPTVTTEMPDTRPMNGGDGANSYAQNSSHQRGVIEDAKGIIFEAIPEKLDISLPSFNSSNPIRVADYGCSTGPNTFIAMQNIVDAVTLKYQSSLLSSPEFHVFFNDHVDNDFNRLFKNLPPSRPYFAAGAPGSFYGQCLPAASLHIAYSSFAMQWLSKVPSEIIDKGSPSWNNRTYCAGTNKEVTKAYFAQFKEDLGAFLRARAQELVEGGLMVFQMPGVPDGGVLMSKTGGGLKGEFLEDSLVDMVNMGVISQEKLDSFNLPIYHPSVEELKTVIDTNDCFTIEKICACSLPVSGPLDVEKTSARIRSVSENFVQEHFGSENMDQLFRLFAEKLQKDRLLYEKTIRQDVYLFALLKRKGN